MDRAIAPPAASLIVFTAASGAGFGLLGLLGVLSVADALPIASGFVPAAVLVGLGLVGGGLAAARCHLGRPARMLLAFTQWRTSWLSREGVAITASIAAAFGFVSACAWPQGVSLRIAAGATMAALAGASVACTAMIYASLRPIPQWHTWLVPAVFLLLASMTGALVLVLLEHCFGEVRSGINGLAVTAILAAWAAKCAYWRQLDGYPAPVGTPVAAWLNRSRRVLLLDRPLADDDRALAETGGGLAWSRARTLRRVAGGLLFALPLVLTVPQPLLGHTGAILAAAAATIAGGAGVLLERWLFFAEARHVSLGWYGVGSDGSAPSLLPPAKIGR
jgi:DMSO reductase anchor subunit